MKLRGNNVLFFVIEVITGILIFILTKFYGDIGLLGIIPFLIGLILTRNTPDERETALLFKASALHSSFLGAIMAILYFKFPAFNLET